MGSLIETEEIPDVVTNLEVGSKENKLAIAHAIAKGYRFILGQDGEGQIFSPDGSVYFISQFICDCPDKVYREGSYEGACKHELWIFQLLPCPMCHKTMALGTFTTCFGEKIQRFECSKCGHARNASLVFQDRRRKRV